LRNDPRAGNTSSIYIEQLADARQAPGIGQREFREKFAGMRNMKE
jgi:hypothetical protein